MKLTRSINLQGVVLTIDEDAYQLLKDYLADIENRLPADERNDVMGDLESRIAELLQAALFDHRYESVTIDMVRTVRARIGEPNEFGENKRPAFKKPSITRQGLGRVFSIVLKAVLIVVGIQLLLPVLAVLFGIIMAFFGVTIGGVALMPALGFSLFGGSIGWTWVLCVSLLAAVGLPLYMVIHWIVKYSRERRHPSLRFWIVVLLLWLLSLGGIGASIGKVLQVNNANISTVVETLDQMEDEWDE